MCRVSICQTFIKKGKVRNDKGILASSITNRRCSIFFSRDFWTSDILRKMTTAYLDKVLCCSPLTRPKWCAGAWNHAFSADLTYNQYSILMTHMETTLHSQHICCHIFCMKLPFDSEIPKQRVQKKKKKMWSWVQNRVIH